MTSAQKMVKQKLLPPRIVYAEYDTQEYMLSDHVSMHNKDITSSELFVVLAWETFYASQQRNQINMTWGVYWNLEHRVLSFCPYTSCIGQQLSG